MKVLICLRDLEPYGIYPLTGEACALSFRILCDLSVTGVRVVRECLSLPYEPACQFNQFAAPWNSKTTDKDGKVNEHVASIMLYPDMWYPLAITALNVIDKMPTILGVMKGVSSRYPAVVGMTAEERFTPAEYAEHKIKKPASYFNTHCKSRLELDNALHFEVQRIYCKGSNPSGGDGESMRNVHAMSGRTT